MRQKKFRAWTGIKMEYDVVVGKFGAFYVNPGMKKDGLDEEDSACLTRFNTRYEDTVPIMQSTGILDKNGVEIYEGDIVEFDTEEGSVQSVIQWVNELSKFMIFYTEISRIKMVKDSDDIVSVGEDLLEIIGNIYSNPELLEQK